MRRGASSPTRFAGGPHRRGTLLRFFPAPCFPTGEDSQGSCQINGTYQYGPFGTSSVASGTPGAGPFQYGGRELDQTGLYYMRARYYSPGLQRFISPDPSGLGGGDVNVYGYAGNSPTNFSDPTGLGLRIRRWINVFR
jgi:RHS repeat-associated protein